MAGGTEKKREDSWGNVGKEEYASDKKVHQRAWKSSYGWISLSLATISFPVSLFLNLSSLSQKDMLSAASSSSSPHSAVGGRRC